MENVIILGTGIAGLTAAVYTARANLNPLVISGPEDGGQLTLTTDVENFPGFPDGVKGPELIENTKKQAARFGARFKVDWVTDFKKMKDGFELSLGNKENIQTKTVIVTTGASARWLGLPSEEKYKGRGVSTCATCDGAFYKGKEVVVIGGGDSAMEESNFLTKFADRVTVIHRRAEFKASRIMQDRFFKNPKCAVIWNSEVVEIVGDGKLVKGVKIKDHNTKKIHDVMCNGVFLAIGHVPNTVLFKGILDLDEGGYIKTDRFMHTSVPGIFAGGDVQDVRYRQAITAAGTGCQAAIEVEKYLGEREE
jgi:thioredoxin reductase (NADPH)